MLCLGTGTGRDVNNTANDFVFKSFTDFYPTQVNRCFKHSQEKYLNSVEIYIMLLFEAFFEFLSNSVEWISSIFKSLKTGNRLIYDVSISTSQQIYIYIFLFLL